MYVPMREYKKLFRVSTTQLRLWADTGKIPSVRSPGGVRLYKMPAEVESRTPKTTLLYARVSSAKQRRDLKRQRDYLLERYPDAEVVTDIGSGINWKRPGLLSILERAHAGCVAEVVVASRDRLCRFAFELLEHTLGMFGTRITVVDQQDQSPEQELSDDLLSIVQVFCCRRNGQRRYSKARSADAKDKAESDAVAKDGVAGV